MVRKISQLEEFPVYNRDQRNTKKIKYKMNVKEISATIEEAGKHIQAIQWWPHLPPSLSHFLPIKELLFLQKYTRNLNLPFPISPVGMTGRGKQAQVADSAQWGPAHHSSSWPLDVHLIRERTKTAWSSCSLLETTARTRLGKALERRAMKAKTSNRYKERSTGRTWENPGGGSALTVGYRITLIKW